MDNNIVMAIGIAASLSLFFMSDFPKLIVLAAIKVLFDEDELDSLK